MNKVYFCSTCGNSISENEEKCIKCTNNTYISHPCTRIYCENFEKEIHAQNVSSGGFKVENPNYWDRVFKYYKPDHPVCVYVCGTCEYFNWHQLQYCPKCGDKIHYIKCSLAEAKIRFKNYKVGPS